jgi:hypothetical protein
MIASGVCMSWLSEARNSSFASDAASLPERVLAFGLPVGEVVEEHVDRVGDQLERLLERVGRDVHPWFEVAQRRGTEHVQQGLEQRRAGGDEVVGAHPSAAGCWPRSSSAAASRYARASASVAKASPVTPVPFLNITMTSWTRGRR